MTDDATEPDDSPGAISRERNAWRERALAAEARLAQLFAIADRAAAVNAVTFSHIDGRDLLAELHPRRSLDIKRRKDGVETWFQADWLSDLWGAIKPLRLALANLNAAPAAMLPPMTEAQKLERLDRAKRYFAAHGNPLGLGMVIRNDGALERRTIYGDPESTAGDTGMAAVERQRRQQQGGGS